MSGLVDIRLRPIGSILDELESRLPEATDPSSAAMQANAAQDVYDEFDQRLNDRPDYRLWRLKVYPHFAYARPILRGGRSFVSKWWPDWSQTALECVDSRDPVVFWSAVALASEIARQSFKSNEIEPESPIWAFVDSLYERLQDEVEPAQNFPASCGLAAAAFLTRHQNLCFRAGRSLALEELNLYRRHVKRWIQVVDPRWGLGSRVNTAALRKEASGNSKLHCLSDGEDRILIRLLDTWRSVLSQATTELSLVGRKLLHDAFLYAHSAWLTARSCRLEEYKALRRRRQLGTPEGEERMRRVFEEEFATHLSTSCAARDAGEYLEAAKHLYLVYRAIPTAYINNPLVIEELNRRSLTFRYLKEAGLELDRRFARTQDPTFIQNRHTNFAERWGGMRHSAESSLTASHQGEQVDLPSTRASSSGDVGFLLRVKQDQSTLPEWKTILREFDAANQTPPGFLLTMMRGFGDAKLPASPAALAAGFSLALRYGYVRTAGKILERSVSGDDFPLNAKQLLAFARQVQRCTQIDPFGMRHEHHAVWQRLVRAGCAKLMRRDGKDWMDATDRLRIHETVTNGISIQHRRLSYRNAKRLYEKTSGLYDVEELREFYDRQYTFSRPKHDVVNVMKLAKYCQRFAQSRLGSPVAISLMRVGDSISVVGVGGNGRPVARDVEAPEIASEIASLIAESGFWFKMAGTEPAWPKGFRHLAKQILAIANVCDRHSRVLLLSMAPDLAQLPWQHLIRSVADKARVLVSIVPNLSAFTHRGKTDPVHAFRFIPSKEGSPEIETIVEAVRSSTNGHDLNHSSVCIIVGHGSPQRAGELPGVRLGDNDRITTLDSWANVLGARIVVLHCCHAGTAKPLFLEEFGGVPGLGISLGTEAFVAPVSEVFASTAVTLQRNLFADPEGEIGFGYRAAIEENAACSLYNLYGSPYERIIPYRSTLRQPSVAGMATTQSSSPRASTIRPA